MTEKEKTLFNQWSIKEDLFDEVSVSDNRNNNDIYLPKILEIEFVIRRKKTERFKQKRYNLMTIYTDGSLQILTEGVGNMVSNEQVDEILRVRDLIKKLDGKS